MLNEGRLLIAGELVAASDGREFETVDPSTGQVLGTAADASTADAQAAAAAAARAFTESAWANDVNLRIRCLRQFHEALGRNKELLRELVVVETGVPAVLSHAGALQSAIDVFGWYVDLLEKYPFIDDLGTVEVRGANHRRWVAKEPVGVAALIVPYNFPILIALHKLAPALAAGCTVVLKGAPDAPWSTAALGAIFAQETDTPPGVVNVVCGASPEVGAVLTTDPLVDMISFTGSTATGRRIMAAASETIKRVHLELGGKSAAVVLDDADFNTAIMTTVLGSCAHAGQGCALTTRLLLPRSRYEEGVELAKGVMGMLPYGDPRDPGVLMGPLISERQRQKVSDMVTQALAEGATAVLGGGVPQHLPQGYYFEPTLLVDVDENSAIAQDEVFGPVLVALPYEDDDDAVRVANNSRYGLSGAIYSADLDRARSVARGIRTGTLSINGGAWYAPDAPFGGYKQSGVGREMGIPGLEEYLERKTVAEPA